MWTKEFWLQTLERAIRAFAAAFGAMLVADEALGVLAVNWGDRASVAAMAAVISVAFSVASSGVGPGSSPSLVRGTADKALDRLAPAARGLAGAVLRTPEALSVPIQSSRPVSTQLPSPVAMAKRTEDVLEDIGLAKP